MVKRANREALVRCAVCKEGEDAKHEGHTFKRDESLPVWHGCWGLRRFPGTRVRMNSDSSARTAKALGNTKEVSDARCIKAKSVLPEVRRSVNAATEGLSVAS
jgi:hypothetical protein